MRRIEARPVALSRRRLIEVIRGSGPQMSSEPKLCKTWSLALRERISFQEHAEGGLSVRVRLGEFDFNRSRAVALVMPLYTADSDKLRPAASNPQSRVSAGVRPKRRANPPKSTRGGDARSLTTIDTSAYASKPACTFPPSQRCAPCRSRRLRQSPPHSRRTRSLRPLPRTSPTDRLHSSRLPPVFLAPVPTRSSPRLARRNALLRRRAA